MSGGDFVLCMKCSLALGKYFAALHRRTPFDTSANDDGGSDGDDDNDDAFIADTTVIELEFESVHPIFMTSSSTLASADDCSLQ